MDPNVIHEARAFLRNFRSIISFADMVDQIGNWESALTEIKLSVKAGQEEKEKQTEAIAALRAEKEAVKGEISALRSKAKEVEAKAKEDAKILLTEAQERVKAEREALEKDINEARQELASIRQDVGKLSKQKEVALRELEDTKKKHAEFKERLLNG